MYTACAIKPFVQRRLMTRLLAMALGVIGLVFLVRSMMVLSYPDVSEWFRCS